MSVVAPKVYATIETDSETNIASPELSFVKVTLPCTTSVGGFEIKVPHGSGSDFSRYSGSNVFKAVDLWLGTSNTGSKMLSGKIDNFKTEFTKDGGYTIDFIGRDLGEALFRHKITTDFFGYTSLYFSKRRGTTSGSYDVYSLEDYTGSAPDSTTTINVGTTGSGSGFYFFVKPYAFTDSPYLGNGGALPAAIEFTGSCTTRTFIAEGSHFELHLRLINSGSSAHSGYMVAKLRFVDDTGSMANPVGFTGWETGSTINFPAYPNYVINDTIYFTSSLQVPDQYIHLEMLWKVIGSGSDTDSGFSIELAQGSFLKIPNDSGLATNVVNTILSGSGISTGSVPWDDTPLTQSYYKKPAFDALREIADIVSWDSKVDPDGLFQAWVRRSITGSSLFQTGSNIFKFSRTRDLDLIKNDVTVRGATEALLPYDGDYWTEFSGSGWTTTSGSIIEADIYATFNFPLATAGKRYLAGTGSQSETQGWLIYQHPIVPSLSLADLETVTLKFYAGSGNGVTTPEIKKLRLKSKVDDNDNYFEAEIDEYPSNAWGANSYTLGDSNITGSSKSGQWVKHGSIQWADLRFIEFYIYRSVGTGVPPLMALDGLHFEGLRWTGSAIDATSTGSYGRRPHEEISDLFHSHAECQSRAEEILRLSKYPVDQFVILTTGSEAIVPGEKDQLLLPSEGVAVATYYDILEVTHMLSLEGFLTQLTLSDKEEIRDVALLQSYGIMRSFSQRSLDDALRGIRRFS